MKYNIKINKVKGDESNVKGFATVTFSDSLVVRNIAIVKNGEGQLFVSMPSQRSNEVNEKGEPVYNDVCNPITKEFYDEFTKNILEAFDKRATLGKEGMDVNDGLGEKLNYTVKVTPLTREDSSLRGIGRIYIEDKFVIGNVKLIEGSNGMFISMPDYRTDKLKDGKPVYREIALPITKECRESINKDIEKSYDEAVKKKNAPKEAETKNEQKKEKTREKKKEELEPALAR